MSYYAVGMRGPASLKELESVELAEAFAAREVGERAGPEVDPTMANIGGYHATRQQTSAPPRMSPCPCPRTPPPECPVLDDWLWSALGPLSLGPPRRTVYINGQPVTATLDSGNLVTLTQPGIVPTQAKKTTLIPITCNHGDTRQVLDLGAGAQGPCVCIKDLNSVPR